ncbi:hypothetical protein Zmor_022489 [Zophobas morio]|uniref:Uncharacterized protein n=1 Tax=Zophobas morio TaxID=2755281 RepID=A0AA38HXR9_9CUCU|nr:hypothetical protein Zmor_022489 [Zophobas morio]
MSLEIKSSTKPDLFIVIIILYQILWFLVAAKIFKISLISPFVATSSLPQDEWNGSTERLSEPLTTHKHRNWSKKYRGSRSSRDGRRAQMRMARATERERVSLEMSVMGYSTG